MLGGCLAAGAPIGIRAQVSPGPLAEPHKEFDKVTACLNCHGSRSMAEHCLGCHEGIAWLVERGRGLHGNQGAEKCARCHPEHAGREFSLIQWGPGEPEGFDHVRTGWRLEGKHRSLECRECHKPEYQKSPAIVFLERQDLTESWVGLEPDCLSCHEDFHRGQLGTDCLKCHTNLAWKPAPGFDHDGTDFALTGKHEDVTCEKCHLAPRLDLALDDKGRPIPLYKPLPHQECSACHDDPHKGELGSQCSRCHVTDDFKKIDRQKFNHDLTRYQLRGRHTRLKCEQCHDPVRAWGKKPPFEACTSCHADPHAGQATVQGRKVDCQRCHAVRGFKPATYSVVDHRTSRFPLEGKHQQAACDKCHVKHPAGIAPSDLGKAGVWIRPVFEACRDCHRDVHGRQLSGRPDGGACDACHEVAGFKPSTFTARQHNQLRVPLLGKHLETECRRCHGPNRPGLPALPGPDVLGSAGVAVRLKDHECRDCHVDPHRGRFVRGGEAEKTAGCLACHDYRSFRPSAVEVKVHATFEFALEGAHRAVPCSGCHEQLAARPRVATLRLSGPRPADLSLTLAHDDCKACHESPHGDQFDRRPDGDACESCHGADAFRPASRFDHNRDAAFPLKGAHARVACEKCHVPKPGPDGKPFVTYRPLSSKCESCHGDKPLSPLEISRAGDPAGPVSRVRPGVVRPGGGA